MTKQNNRLTRSSKNRGTNKELLRSEIEQATDPKVRLELTRMLLDIEQKEKRKKVQRWLFLGLGIISIFLFLLYLGHQSTKESKVEPLTTSSSTSTSSSTEVKETAATGKLETQLTTKQLEKWVMAILDLLPPPPSKYLLNTYIDDKDNLAYIHVGIDQMDGFGTFRVNAKGQLEFKSRLPMADWEVISEAYLDTNLAKKYFAEKQEETKRLQQIEKERQMTFDEAVSYVISHSDDWLDLTDEEKEDLEIISVNDNFTDMRTDETGDYYPIDIETNREPRGVMLRGVQFKVYLDDGMITQRILNTSRDDWIELDI